MPKIKVTKPTVRQKKVVAKLSENIRTKGKTKSLGKILRESGYSKRTSEKPKLVTESKGFRELLKDLMPDDKVAQLQADLMESSTLDSYRMDVNLTDKEIAEIVEGIKGCKVRRIFRSKGDVIVYFWSPDNNTRRAALDMFYKLDSKYPKEKEEGEAATAIKKYLDKLSKILP